MSESDHFASHVDGDSVEHGHQPPDNIVDADVSDLDDGQPAKKKSLPTPLLLGGGTVLVVAALFGYKHFVKASPDQQAASASVSSLSADGGGMIPSAPTQPGPLPAQGMAGDMAPKAVVPLPAQDPASAPAGPVPTVATMRPASLDALASSGGALQPASAAAASVSASSPPMASAATPPAAPVEAASTPDAPNTALIASTPATAGAPANDGKDAEIRKLRQELKRAKHALAQRRPGHHASKETVAHADVDADGGDSAASAPAAPAKKKSTHAHRNGKHKRERVEVQLGYHIKQVIPGQGWIEEEETGKQRVVAVGDKIGTAEVTRIDADNYKIYTTAGVIQ